MSILRQVFFPAAASVLMLAGGCEMPKQQQSEPETPKTEEPRYVDSLDVFEDTTGIGALRSEFARTQMGRDILTFLDAHDVPLVYNKEYCEREKSNALYADLSHKIRIHPNRPMGVKMKAVSHEAKHGYNSAALGTSRARRSLMLPQYKWTMFQLDEADAFAFSSYFMAVRQVEGVDSIPEKPVRFEDKITRDLLPYVAGDSLTMEKYKKLAFDPALTRVNMAGYTDFNADYAKEMHKKNIPVERLRKALAQTPDAEGVEFLMTGFGGLSFDPAAETVFKDAGMSVSDIASRYVFLKINKSTQQNLDSFFTAENAINAKIRTSLLEQKP